MRMLRLHSCGTPVLVNPAQILIVFPRENAAGTEIYFRADDDPVHIDESLDTIDRLVSLG